MKKHLLLCLFLCISYGLFGNVYFKHLGKPEGLSQFSVLSICQDELGRMWFGTLEGLNCYDGSVVNAYKPSLNDAENSFGNQVDEIVSDKNGNVFFISDGMLVRYDIYKETFTPLHRQGSCLHVHGHDVFMSANDSVFKWDIEKKQFDLVYHLKLRTTITCLYVDDNNSLWIGTRTGLYRLSGQEREIPVCVIPNSSIHSLYRDSKKRMWVATFRQGMYKIENGVCSDFPFEGEQSLSNNDVRCFVEDNERNLWIGTFDGLNKIDTLGNVSYYKRDILPGSLQHSSIFSLYKDGQGTVWVGTFYGGVHYFNPENDIFKHYSEHIGRTDCLNYFFVGKMAEDKRGDLWICTEGGGLNHLDRKTNLFTSYQADGSPNSIPINILKCIEYDEEHDCLYIGTHKQGFFRFDIPTKRVEHYADFKKTGASFAEIVLYRDSLYLLSSGGMLIKGRQNDNVEYLYPTIPESHKDGISFLIDSKRNLWIAQYSQVLRINMDNPLVWEAYKYGENGLGRFPVQKIVEGKNGKVYLGTNGSGVYEFNEKGNNFAYCSMIPVRYCYDMLPTPKGYLAISSEQGLLICQPQTGEVKLIDTERRLHLSGLNDGSGLLLCKDGEFFVGGVGGMTSFMNTALSNTPLDYNLYFSSLMVNNRTIQAGTPGGILETALPFTRRIDLNHNENNLSISFISNNYVDNATGKGIYEYRLEGFNEDWITSLNNTIVYTNLNPGDYTLVVREKEQNARGETHVVKLEIVVHSPWYATWTAYLAYMFILTAIAYALTINWRTRMKLRASLAQEKLEKEKNEELIQAKLQFFANISHEFRTPLTLIISQVESLMQSGTLSPFLRTRLQKIYRNTFQFRELISELLDFRKMERGKLHLRVCRMDMVPYLERIYQDFKNQAQSQNIDFKFRVEAESLMCWCDSRQLRKVFSNLLTNAFKHTPEKGRVELLVEEKEDRIVIKVIDSGEGIPQKDLPFVFDRFYQVDSSTVSPGSGIGLALSKGVVELHHGEIDVQSALEYGSIFTVVLSKENKFTQDNDVTFVEPEVSVFDIVQAEPGMQDKMLGAEEESVPDAEADAGELEETAGSKPCILLVEDNEELLQTLTSLFSPSYRVIIAMNGKDGLDKATEEQPDVILSDVMMPIMSGIEMCSKIKNNFDLCHIPVILLTALTSDNKKMEGLQCGADEYIEKPFSNKMLLGHIANILRNRMLLRRKYSESAVSAETETVNMEALALNPIDAKFLAKFDEIVKEHLSDTEFDVNTLAKELGVSRSSLYGKLKALSSMTPNEFVLNARLKYAAGLLRNNPELQITEIAYQAGFNSLRYFRHCFKACFNQTPQEYRG